MLSKFLITVGALTVVLGVFGVVFGIYSGFANIDRATLEGMSVVTWGIDAAIVSVFIGTGGSFVFTIGIILFSVAKKRAIS